MLSDTNLTKLKCLIISTGIWCINFFHVYADYPISFRIAKGFGLNLRVWSMFLYFTMCRSILNGRFEKHKVFHKFIGYIMTVSTLGHTIAHIFYSRVVDLTHVTGYILFSILMLMFISYFSSNYSIFKNIHLFYYVFPFIEIIHVPKLWYWFTLPIAIYSVELFINFDKLMVSEVKNFDRQGDHMFISLPHNLDSIPGSYYYLCAPQLGYLEWHPFSVCSSASVNHLTFMIEAKGDWTKALYESNVETMLVMGPFKTSSSKIINSDVKEKVIFCTGIGITPFISVINTKIDEYHNNNRYRSDYSHAFSQDIEQCRSYKITNEEPGDLITYRQSTLEIHWVFRDICKVKNFFEYIKKILDKAHNITLHIYVTASMSPKEREEFVKLHRVPRIKSIHFSRPKLENIKCKQIYFCGNPNARESLKRYCKKNDIELFSEVF